MICIPTIHLQYLLYILPYNNIIVYAYSYILLLYIKYQRYTLWYIPVIYLCRVQSRARDVLFKLHNTRGRLWWGSSRYDSRGGCFDKSSGTNREFVSMHNSPNIITHNIGTRRWECRIINDVELSRSGIILYTWWVFSICDGRKFTLLPVTWTETNK